MTHLLRRFLAAPGLLGLPWNLLNPGVTREIRRACAVAVSRCVRALSSEPVRNARGELPGLLRRSLGQLRSDSVAGREHKPRRDCFRRHQHELRWPEPAGLHRQSHRLQVVRQGLRLYDDLARHFRLGRLVGIRARLVWRERQRRRMFGDVPTHLRAPVAPTQVEAVASLPISTSPQTDSLPKTRLESFAKNRAGRAVKCLWATAQLRATNRKRQQAPARRARTLRLGIPRHHVMPQRQHIDACPPNPVLNRKPWRSCSQVQHSR